jgi:fatty acid oxidation complex alpha subunit
MTNNALSAVRIDIDDGVAILTIDVEGEKQNLLNEASAHALRAAFARVATDASIRGAVLISGKADFIAGADVQMIKSCTSSAQVEAVSREMQSQLAQIEVSTKPVVAAIHGACLGGGLEVALACHYRIATDDNKTQLGLPEVMLGLIPGGGGTQRLPRLIGAQAALDMMLTGKMVRANKAKRIGLIDMVVLPYGLREAAVVVCRRLLDGSLSASQRRQSQTEKAMEAALEDNAAGRFVLFHQARTQVMDKTQGLYPAPLALLDVVEIGMSKGLAAGYEAESKRFAELAQSDTARNLMHLFGGQTALKKNRFASSVPLESGKTAVGVVGAGLMGAGIASVTVQKLLPVVMKDVSREALARGQKTIWNDLDKRAQSRSITPFERDRLLSSVVSVTDYAGFHRCGIVVEAVFEELSLKHKVLAEIEAHVDDDCIVASNTSALPIGDIAKASKRPHNVLGMHYFSPVQKMPLLEVVLTPKTSKRAAARAVQLGLQQGKTVIVVKDGPGFYTTRILGPVMEEAMYAALDGVGAGISLHDIDDAMKAWGFPVGPITLLDEVGLDVALHVARDLQLFFAPRFGNTDLRPLQQLVDRGLLGRKSNKGFFGYDQQPRDVLSKAKKFFRGAQPRPIHPDVVPVLREHARQHPGKMTVEDIQLRIGLRMINEAAQCLADGILDNPIDGDIGAVFGLGFPPMKGGPFRYLDSAGASFVVGSLERLSQQHGQRFTPAQILVDAARSGRRFHAS